MAFNNYLSNVSPQFTSGQAQVQQPQNQQQLMAAYAYQQQLMMQQQHQQQQAIDQKYQPVPQTNPVKMQYPQTTTQAQPIAQIQQPMYSTITQTTTGLTPEQIQMQQHMQYQQVGYSAPQTLPVATGYGVVEGNTHVSENFTNEREEKKPSEQENFDWENVDVDASVERKPDHAMLGKRAAPEVDDGDFHDNIVKVSLFFNLIEIEAR